MHYTLITFARIDSTQRWARGWAELGAGEGLAVQADEQTAGRGRLQRSWWSPPDSGLYLSVLLRPRIPLTQAPRLTMLAALAAADACAQIAGIRPQAKWPNDLIWQGRKLAGILTELGQAEGQLRYAVIGLGLNVNTHFQGDLAGTATSLAAITARRTALPTARDAFLAALARRYDRFLAGESPHTAWQQDLAPLGRRVRVEQPNRPDLVGQAVGVHPDGALLVCDDRGILHTVWAGDLHPL